MGKKRRKKQVVPTPSFESPVCPTCGKPDALVEESRPDDPMYECTSCEVRFMYEDVSVELEEDDDAETAACNINSGVAPLNLKCVFCHGKNGKGADGDPCELCAPKKKKEPEYMTEPLFGEVEELTDAVAKRS